MKCERNTVGLHSDPTSGPFACGKPAHWYVDGYAHCDEHCIEELRKGSDEVTDLDGDAVTLDGDGDLARAS